MRLLHSMRRIRSDLRAILCSGCLTDKDCDASVGVTGDWSAIIEKPFGLIPFLQTVRKVSKLDHRRPRTRVFLCEVPGRLTPSPDSPDVLGSQRLRRSATRTGAPFVRRPHAGEGGQT